MSSAERLRRALLVVLLAAAGAGAQQVEDVPEATIIRPAGSTYFFPDPDDPSRYKLVFLGGVDIERGLRRLHGDTLVVTLRGGAGPAPAPGEEGTAIVPDSRLLELFLDGHVSLSEGDERVSEASTYHLDNETGVATIVQGELHAPRAAGQPPLAARFETLRRLQDGTLHLSGFRYTNCSYGQPHWHVQTPWAELRDTPEGRVLETGSNIVRVGDVPVFWLPGATVNLDRDEGFLLRRVHVGRSSRFGSELLLEWGGDASPAASTVSSLFGGPEQVDASWSFAAEWLTDRGVLFEPKLKYETEHSQGEIFGSYINDSADEDHLDQPITDHSRGRIDVQHRTRIDDRRTLDIEVSRESDANFLKEYYEREFREDKPQETYASYRDVVDNRAFTVLASTRLNDFQSQVVYQPEVALRHVAEPVLGGFATVKEFVSNGHKLPSNQSAQDSEHTLRVGSELQVEWPFDLPNGDRVRALLGADLTWFDQTVDDGAEARTAGSAGVEWARAFHGTDSEAHSETWNIDGLRRLAELRVGYFDRYYVSMLPNELVPIDQIETLSPVRAFTLEWRDRWQTHQEGEVRTLLDTDWLIPIYPDDNRDNDGDTLGPLQFDGRWRPGANLVGLRDAVLHWRTLQDLDDGHYVKSFASYNTSLGEGRRLHLSNNRAYHEFNFVTAAVTWLLNEKWAVAVYHQLDQRDNESVRSGVVLRQRAHCWYVDLELSSRRGGSVTGDDNDETRVSIALTPAGPADEDLAEKIGGRYF